MTRIITSAIVLAVACFSSTTWAACSTTTSPTYLTVTKDGSYYVMNTPVADADKVFATLKDLAATCVFIRADKEAAWQDVSKILVPLVESGEIRRAKVQAEGKPGILVLQWEAP
jgi:biopolymer transport protein ExbD